MKWRSQLFLIAATCLEVTVSNALIHLAPIKWPKRSAIHETKTFRDLLFSRNETLITKRWNGFEKYAESYTLQKFTSQLSLLLPVLFSLSFLGGIEHYSVTHHWSFPMSLFYATQAFMGEMYDVPVEDGLVDQTFTIGFNSWGSICVAGALGAFGASFFGKIVNQQRSKLLVQYEDLNNDGKIDNTEKVFFLINNFAVSIGWFDHQSKYLTVLATLAWFALGVWYEVNIDGVPLRDSMVFIWGSLSGAGITGPPCEGDNVFTCTVPEDLSYFLTAYLIVGVPLFTLTVGQFARLVVERAVRADEAMRMLAPITEEEFAFASRISTSRGRGKGISTDIDIGNETEIEAGSESESDITTITDVAASTAINKGAGASTTSDASDAQLEFGDFVTMNLLRLQRLHPDEITFFGRMFSVIDVDHQGTITRNELRRNFMYASFVAAEEGKRKEKEKDNEKKKEAQADALEGDRLNSSPLADQDASTAVDQRPGGAYVVDFAGTFALAPSLLVSTLMIGTLYYSVNLHWTLPTSIFYAVQVVMGHNYGVPSLPSFEASVFTLCLHCWASVFLTAVLGSFASGFVQSSVRTGRKKALLLGPIDLNNDGKISWYEMVAYWTTNFALSIDVEKERVNLITAAALLTLLGIGTGFCTVVEGWDAGQGLVFTAGALSSAGEPAPPCTGGDNFTCAIDPPLACFFAFLVLLGVPLFTALLGQFSSLVLDKAIRTDEINKIFTPVSDEEFERVGALSGSCNGGVEEIDMGEFVVMMALRLGRLSEEEMTDMRLLFLSLDVNGNGMVSRDEIRARVNCNNIQCLL